MTIQPFCTLFSFLLLLSYSFTSCQSKQESKTSESPKSYHQIHLIKDSKELIVYNKKGEIQGQWSVKIDHDIPLGVFFISQQNTSASLLNYPSPIYRRKFKAYQLSDSKKIRFATEAQEGFYNINMTATELSDFHRISSTSAELPILILPNNFHQDKSLKACYACPHWMAEIFGEISLHLSNG